MMNSWARQHRKAAAAIAMVVILVIVDLIIVGMVIGGGRDHDLTVKRMETLRAFYAAEAGMNMAIRELMENADEDVDGGVGTISADDPVDDANDPVLGKAQVVVTAEDEFPVPGKTTLTSEGRSGDARREMEAEILKAN